MDLTNLNIIKGIKETRNCCGDKPLPTQDNMFTMMGQILGCSTLYVEFPACTIEFTPFADDTNTFNKDTAVNRNNY